MKPHSLAILVENKAGVLSRVTGLFSRRGFNIESLAVGTCEEPGMSRITIVVIGDDEKIEQVMIAQIFRAQIVDVGSKSVILQVVGDTDKIDALEKLLRQYGVKELVRTGRIGILRGSKTAGSGK
jgi:acetolactate synthase-1/3 small subunit